MLNRNFNAWLSGFRDSIADYGYYIDFEKVHRNVNKVKVELNILNSLIGSKKYKRRFPDIASQISGGSEMHSSAPSCSGKRNILPR